MWTEIESADLVPGDMISFKMGDVVPADCHLMEVINLSIDQPLSLENRFFRARRLAINILRHILYLSLRPLCADVLSTMDQRTKE
jgi:hypothetical protein